MRSMKAIVLVGLAITGWNFAALGQMAPNTDNGIKSFGSYEGGGIDTVNLQNGNVSIHIPLFSYPQRGKLPLRYWVQGNSKNWQVGQYFDKQNNAHYRWMLSSPGDVYFSGDYDVQLQRVRTLSTDVNDNLIESDFDYGVHTPDGAIHWLVGSGANGSMLAVDGSGFQLMLTRGTAPDHSDDSAVLTDGHGTIYRYNRIWWPVFKTSPLWGTNVNVISHVNFVNTSLMDPANTVQTFNDRGMPANIVDSNGNTQVIYSLASDGVTLTNPSFDVFGRQLPFVLTANAATPTTDFSGCVSSMTINSADLFNFPGPDGRSSSVKACFSNFTPSPTFSQPNVEPPSNDLVFRSYPEGLLPLLDSLAMPDGNHWSFTYDNYENLTSITLPTGGTISYSWQEVSLPTCEDGSATLVSRAVASRTVNDLVNPPQMWQYTWGTVQQDGSITNYVRDPNGNETAHVFKSPVTGQPCALYETETRTYQGSHLTGKLLKTVDTHYTADYSNTQDLNFPGNVFADTMTTTLPGNKVSQVVRQHDPGPAGSFGVSTLSQVTDEKVYDYGNTLLRETATTYEWQVNPAYFNAGLIDLPASVVIKDGSGCSMAETDYTYDEPSYLTTYPGTLPAGTHGTAPGGTVRGNLTTVTKWAAPTSSCNPKSGTAIISHTNWYDTGQVYQQIDPLGRTTTYSYDPYYAGAYATETCSPQTGSVAHCVSGTYDSVTGLLESLTNENATAQASGNTQGDSAHTSNYSYDTSWRLVQSQAPPDPANANARSTTTFTPSAPNSFPLSVQHQHSVTTTLMDTSTAFFDGVDRVNETTHALPNGTATVMTTYDGVGQATSVTNPYFTTSDPNYGMTSSYYDGLGRVTQTTKQDGSISTATYDVPTSIAMNADCTITADEAGKQRGACTDALGRLVEVDEPNPGATPTVSNYATMQTDGNFVLYNPTNEALWSSGTSGSGAGPVMMQDDGNLVIYIFKWSAGTYAAPSPGPFAAQSCSIGTYLVVGQSIHANQCIVSPHGQYMLYMDPGGNFFIYDIAHGTGTWGANTAGHPGAYALMQSDGNLVVYDANNNFLWMSGTNGTYAERLDMEDDGRIIIYKSAWNSGTSTGQFNWTQLAHPACDAGTGTGTSGILGAGQCFVSPNGHFALFLQTDGNLVLYDRSTTPNTALWMTNTPISPADPGVALRTLYTYNALGNLTCVEQHGGVTGTGCSSSPANDATSPWRVRRFTYDSVSRLLTATNPESGTISYLYDADGNITQKTSPAPNQTGSATQTISYCFDELHRVTGRAYGALSCPLASPVVSYTYDSAANAKGKLVSMTDQAGTATYAFDILGRMTSETRTLTGANNGTISKTLSYEYNLDGSLAKLHYPSGAVITYTPDSAGRITQAVDSGNGINYVTGATYGPDGSLTNLVNGSGGTAAITNNFTYNKRLQPVTMSAATSSQTVFSIGYDFHFGNGDNGNVYGITNSKDTTRNQTFTYDLLNRLLSAQNAGTNCALTTLNGKTKYWGNNYIYDGWGNLLQKNVTKCSSEHAIFTMNGNNQALYYSYDAAGNMLNDGIFSYTFDQENRITGANGYTYTYDGDGNRVRKSNSATSGTLYWYMAPGIVAETDLSGTLTSEYVFFRGERVARKDFSGSTTSVSYYFSDQLKTASVITDSAGNIKADSDYYPWGGELQYIANDSNHFKFTGKERDGETGLDYFGARYYENATARFMTPDSPFADQHASDPQSWNLYSYTRNNPLAFIDDTGHGTRPANSPAVNKALLQDPTLHQVILASNNFSPGAFEDALNSGKLSNLGSGEGSKLRGLAAEADVADGLANNLENFHRVFLQPTSLPGVQPDLGVLIDNNDGFASTKLEDVATFATPLGLGNNVALAPGVSMAYFEVKAGLRKEGIEDGVQQAVDAAHAITKAGAEGSAVSVLTVDATAWSKLSPTARADFIAEATAAGAYIQVKLGLTGHAQVRAQVMVNRASPAPSEKTKDKP